LDGEHLYKANCATCHEVPETKSPPIRTLRQMPLSRILMAMEFGKMQPQAAALTPQQRLAIGQWLALAEDTGRDDWIEQRACAAELENLPVDGSQNWGSGTDNARYVEAGVDIDAANIGQLELAWSLAVPLATDMRSQPLAVGDTVFLGTQNGNLLALDQASGCVRWRFRAQSTIRSALSIGTTKAGVPSLFFADDIGTVYSVDARNGTGRWKRSLRLFPTTVISGSLTYHDGRVIVPLSSFEVAAAGLPTHECCRSHGAVVAVNADSGETFWEYHTTPHAQKTGVNSAGVQMWGPSGASVWSTPTIDDARGLVYVGTGENLSRPATTTSDAVIAIDLASGEERWHFQGLADDVWNGACQLQGPNCPENPGPDWDIGASVILTRGADGRDVLLVGQKSGEAFALDPDAGGKVLWRKRLSQGTANGGNSGIHWGMASDGRRVFAPVSDPDWKLPGYTPRPGVYALDVRDGRLIWSHPVTRGCDFDPADAPRAGLAEMRQADGGAKERSLWPDCGYFYAHSAAALLANGVVYAGALDGKLRALDADTGVLLRQFETARPFSGSNGIEGHGGAIDVGGVVVSGRYLFIVSGYSMFGQMPGNVLLAYRLPD
jgi:polyvinyl alcohol dehydrogenase (cytochrome)